MATAPAGTKPSFQEVLQEQSASWWRTKEIVKELLEKLADYNCVIHKWIATQDTVVPDVLLEPAVRKTLQQELDQDQLRIILLGPNSAGKSSLLNAMLGAPLMHTGTGHVTGRVCRLRYVPPRDALIRFQKLSEAGELGACGLPDLPLLGVTVEQLKSIVQENTARPGGLDEAAYMAWAEIIVEVRYPFPLLESGPELWDSPGTSAMDEPVIQSHLRQVLFHLSLVPVFVYRNPTFGDAELCALRLLDEIYFASVASDALPVSGTQSHQIVRSQSGGPSPQKPRGVFFLNTFADIADVMADLDEEEMGDPAALERGIDLDTQSRLALLCQSQAAVLFPELKSGYDSAPFACASAMDVLVKRQQAEVDKRWRTMLERLISFCAEIDTRRQQRCLRIAKSVASLFFFFKDQAERLNRNETNAIAQDSRAALQQFQSRLKQNLNASIEQFRSAVLAGLRAKHDVLLRMAETLSVDGYEGVLLNEVQQKEAGGALKDKLARYVDQTVIEPATSRLRQQVHRVLHDTSRLLVVDTGSATTVESVLADSRALAVAIRPMMSTERAIGQAILMPVSVTTAVARLLVHTATGGVRLDGKAKRSVAEGLLKQIAESTEKCEFADLRSQVARLGTQWTALFQRVAEEHRLYLVRLQRAIAECPTLFDSEYAHRFMLIAARITTRLTLLKGRVIQVLETNVAGRISPRPLLGQPSNGVQSGTIIEGLAGKIPIKSSSLVSVVTSEQPLQAGQLLPLAMELTISLVWKRHEKAIRQESPQRACLLLLRAVAVQPCTPKAYLAYEGGGGSAAPLLRPLSTVLAEHLRASIPAECAVLLMRAITTAVVELQERKLDRSIAVTVDNVVVTNPLSEAPVVVARIAPFSAALSSAVLNNNYNASDSKGRLSKKAPPRLPSDRALHQVLQAVMAKSGKRDKDFGLASIRAAKAVLIRLTKKEPKKGKRVKNLVPDLRPQLRGATNSPRHMRPQELKQ